MIKIEHVIDSANHSKGWDCKAKGTKGLQGCFHMSASCNLKLCDIKHRSSLVTVLFALEREEI